MASPQRARAGVSSNLSKLRTAGGIDATVTATTLFEQAEDDATTRLSRAQKSMPSWREPPRDGCVSKIHLLTSKVDVLHERAALVAQDLTRRAPPTRTPRARPTTISCRRALGRHQQCDDGQQHVASPVRPKTMHAATARTCASAANLRYWDDSVGPATERGDGDLRDLRVDGRTDEHFRASVVAGETGLPAPSLAAAGPSRPRISRTPGAHCGFPAEGDACELDRTRRSPAFCPQQRLLRPLAGFAVPPHVAAAREAGMGGRESLKFMRTRSPETPVFRGFPSAGEAAAVVTGVSSCKQATDTRCPQSRDRVS